MTELNKFIPNQQIKCEIPGNPKPKAPEENAPKAQQEDGAVMEAFKKDVFGNNKQLKRRQ